MKMKNESVVDFMNEIGKDDRAFPKSNPAYFEPLANIELSVNNLQFFLMRFVYEVIYKISPEKEKHAEEILSDSDVKDYFISKQVNKNIWPYVREEVSSTMGKFGLKPVYLQLLR